MPSASPPVATAPGHGGEPPADYIPPVPPDGPAPGELHIKEQRSWRTWQLVMAMLVALLIGMWLNYHSGGTQPTNSHTEALPPPAATGATTTVPPSGPGAHHDTTGGGATTTTGAVTTTTAASATTPTTAPGTQLQLLLPATQMKGNWTSPTFTTTAAPWNIGWAFQCTPAPVSGPSFQVFVAPAGGNPAATPAVNETGASGQSISTASTIGAQVLVVKAPAGCEWAVKVTGN